MTMEEFHRARQMFIIVKGTIWIAPRNLAVSHIEWLADMVGIDLAHKLIAECPRGYVWEDRLVAYIKDNFERWVPGTDLRLALAYFDVTHHRLINVIGVGAVPSEDGSQPWPPKLTITREQLAQWKS